MIKSLLVKAAMLAMTAATALWIGWPVHNPSLGDSSSDGPQAMPSPSSIMAPAISPAPPFVPERRHARPPKSREVQARSKLDLNHATAEEFRRLPGIGEVLAQRMVDWRTVHGPYRKVEDLGEVKGIGAKRLEKLRPLIAAGRQAVSEP